jgi:ABC-type Fe3+/spermidine/putrescine transport system ATPase subunit
VRNIALKVDGLVRRYTANVTVGPISFEVDDGEFFSLLGPSGCGKSTTLRSIAGFERLDEGTITLAGSRIDQKPPHQRDIGLVFQSHALFPHLSVAKNISFGLTLRKVSPKEIATRLEQMLGIVGLGGFEDRMPHQLSGGQQQRVALARSLILEPSLLLLDEPMSSLDLKLRVQMREELRALQRRLRKTTVFVTHDQTEALALSDRIAVLSHGHIEQIGTPREIYDFPASRFVADFIGSSNLFEAEVTGQREGEFDITTRGGLKLTARSVTPPQRRDVVVLVRPERLSVTSAAASSECGGNSFLGKITDISYLGQDTQLRVLAGASETLLVSSKSTDMTNAFVGAETVRVHVAANDIRVLEH